MKKILCGADRLPAYASLFRNQSVGLITNPSGITGHFIQTADYFAQHHHLAALFAPEHGVRGDAQDGQTINAYKDMQTGAPVYSIYGAQRAPTSAMMDGLDCMVYDMQDVGSRYYTFIYTMTNCMQACAVKNIPFIVLDRPNPLGGMQMEGTHMQPQNRSFIGMYDIPQRYALTCGELANCLNETEHFGTQLTVIPMQNWQRTDLMSALDIPQISPSPNLPAFESILLYNGTCLFEGVNVSEGRGTTRPFQCVGAPWINPYHFAEKLNALHLPGVQFRPMYFTPMFSKHAKEFCGGVQVHLLAPEQIEPLRTGAAMIITLKEMYPDCLRFVPPNHEKGDFTIDLLWGSDFLRTEHATIAAAEQKIKTDTADFCEKHKKYQIY